MASWNDRLLRHALPSLWKAALLEMVVSPLPTTALLKLLPRLDSDKLTASWKPCAALGS